MTCGTPDSLLNVDAVIEVDKAGKIVYPDPLNRSVIAKTLSDRRQYRAIRPHLAVAVHARLCRRNACEGAGFNRGVAVTAIDSVVADVMLMAEWDRLSARDADFSDVGRLIDGGQRSHQRYQQDSGAENADSGDGIGAGMKYLGHSNPHESRHVRTVDRPGNKSADRAYREALFR